jgi:H+/Cl- antiporter ClcA
MQVSVREFWALVVYLVKWFLIAGLLGTIVGSACAVFLWSLELATTTRMANPWLLWLLPAGGAAVGWLYWRCGESVVAGNNLIVNEIHEPGGGVPLRMAPLVLAGTILTHLCGGSAGREGTAVQMGGSLASGLTRILPGLTREDIRTLLMAGVSSGFAGVFGTPVAGMIFALEVLTIGRMNYSAIVPCLIAAVVGDQVCLGWGIEHTHYQIASRLSAGSVQHLASVEVRLMSLTIVAGILFGLAAVLFTKTAHGMQALFRRLIVWPVARPVAGGLLIIGLVRLFDLSDYLGLGVSSSDPEAVTIVSSFRDGGADAWSWWWKILLTGITLGSGFKGGEVTPLFFVGAALGNTLAVQAGAPVDLLAALGFVSVFAGATNTPLACIVMSVELFGGEYLIYFAVSCLVAYLFSGPSGIYLAQRTGAAKPGAGT